MPTTRQCCGVVSVATTTRAEIDTISSVLKDARLSHALLGIASAIVYFASELLAFENGCAPAEAAVAHRSPRASKTRVSNSFDVAAAVRPLLFAQRPSICEGVCYRPSSLAVLGPRILASRHDQYATWFVLLARTLSTACEDRAEDASQEVAVRLHFATARQPFALAILHLNYMVPARGGADRINDLSSASLSLCGQ